MQKINILLAEDPQSVSVTMIMLAQISLETGYDFSIDLAPSTLEAFMRLDQADILIVDLCEFENRNALAIKAVGRAQPTVITYTADVDFTALRETPFCRCIAKPAFDACKFRKDIIELSGLIAEHQSFQALELCLSRQDVSGN